MAAATSLRSSCPALPVAWAIMPVAWAQAQSTSTTSRARLRSIHGTGLPAQECTQHSRASSPSLFSNLPLFFQSTVSLNFTLRIVRHSYGRANSGRLYTASLASAPRSVDLLLAPGLLVKTNRSSADLGIHLSFSIPPFFQPSYSPLPRIPHYRNAGTPYL